MNGFVFRLNRSISTLSHPNYLFQCNKQIQDFFRQGHVEHAQQLFDEMPQRDSITWNSMISGYCNNGYIDAARSLFDAFQAKNVRTWTSMLSGYAKAGRVCDAVLVFDAMPERNIVSYNAMLSGYLQNGEIERAREFFDAMSDRNLSSWNAMITGYCRTCRMREAREVFDEMPERNEVSYMVVISGHVAVSEYEEAWRLFLDMRRRCEVRPDQQILLAVLSAITGLDDSVLITCFLPLALKTGYVNDVVVGTAILNTLTRIGSLDLAFEFFNDMPEKNEYSWSTMISAFSQCGRLEDAIELYKQVPQQSIGTQTAMMTGYAQNGRMIEARHVFDTIKNPTVLTLNALLSGYVQNGMVEEAKDVFLRMPAKDVASWGTMVSGLVQNGDNEQALELVAEMHRLGIAPNHSGLTTALCACANIGNVEMGKQIHSLTVKLGCQFNSFVGNGLINMYAKCKNIEDFSRTFEVMKVRDTVSWNSLITGLSENQRLSDAVEVFQRMPNHNVVSWTSLISAYAQAEQGEVAFELFCAMLDNGIKPSEQTVTSVLTASASLGVKKLGEQIHALAHKLGLNSRLFVGNALITMYFKCGSHEGFQILEDMAERDDVTWNAILTGCAQNGLGKEAIFNFEKMKSENVPPNQITFLQLLSACSHSGLVDEGLNYFDSMSKDYGITPSLNHYTAVVDLLGRLGRLSEAESLINSMPMKPDTVTLDALLAACKIHGDMDLGERIAERLFHMGTKESGVYVLLSNIYAARGMWGKVGKVRSTMLNREVNKEPGLSWIYINNKLFSFLTGHRTMHDQALEVCSMLEKFYMQFMSAGYVPETGFVLHDVDEEQKQIELMYHSEKVALVFGILRTPHGSPIQIMKNLRVCGDCHSFMKFMSEYTQRKIVIRDGNRFHHIHEGLCSCGDYW